MFEFGDEFYAIYGTDVAREGFFMAPDVYVREFVHQEDVQIVELEIEKALTTTEQYYAVNMEHRIIRRDGAVRTIVKRINIIRDDAGKIVKWYGANQDITEHKRAEEALRQKTEEIRHMAYTDVLTGLPNRAHLNERLDQEMEQARRGESSGVVMFIDLDDLKTVNDTLGHTYGDVLIVEAGKRIVAEAGNDAFVGRIGGDEFILILSGERDRTCIARLADRIIGALCRDTSVFGERLHISASAGAAIYPDDGDTAGEIFKNADNAMYAAKNAGKNCWTFYDTDMQAAAYEKMLLTNSLRHAVERRELVLHYQPQVGAADGVIVGFEALLRWNSTEHGSISPARFIPLAEQSGLIHMIGNWVLRGACQFARRLADQGLENIYVAVNVSPYQLAADGFMGSVSDALHSAGIAPRQLEIEITENALIASLEESICKLGELQAMGVRLALDDFGTGYSSLTYLQRLPVKTLKIDKSFMDMIMMDGTHKAIIGSIVEMAHVMEMSVVAEGVEIEQQIDYLIQCRCDLLQGYIISRPVPEDDAVRLLIRL
jgi:diguanylate cyclase (GGDEF)-like protein